MFILVVARGYPTPANPLRGIFEFDQAKALRDAGHKVIVLSLDLRSVRRKRKLGLYQIHVGGVGIVNISFPVGNVPAWLFVTIGELVFRVAYRLIKNQYGQPDIFHAHFPNLGAITSRIAKRNKVPYVVTEHSSNLANDIISRKLFYYCESAYYRADAIISVSTPLSKRLIQHFDVKSVVVPNILDHSAFFYEPAESDEFVLISVGSLIYRKGFDLLIKAFYMSRIPNSRLYIVGEGLERQKLQRQIDDLNLSDKIVLMGMKTRKEINELMSFSKVFLLASRRETFGVVCIEAMAAGLPVIATRCGGPEDFINEANGLLVDVDNAKQLSQAMVKLYEDYHTYDRAFISSSCRETFGPEAIAKKLTKLYKETIGAINKNFTDK